MDFGDILEKWHGRGEAPIHDKDAEAGDAGESAVRRRRRLLAKNPDAVIDLHGLSRDEAWNALEFFFQNALREDFEKLRIVHGKGNHGDGEGILKRSAREFIERCPYAGENGHEKAAAGGSGATWVILKRKQNYRSR
ncbi:MAG: Smr/MutS family protein [Treponema sp.]|nr:Smr/MutS family protein [Treponema sp.]